MAFKLPPALIAGNTIVIKPAPTTPLTTLRIGELIRDIVPAGVVNFITRKGGVKPVHLALSGGVGYFAANGDMDTAIVLRTGIVKDGTLYVQAGGGVVADSDPQYEFDETVNKAKAVFRAADEAERVALSPSRQGA